MKNIQKDRGITLVALVITIIILLILAGITILQLTGSGLFENAKLAKEKSDAAQEKEEVTLADYTNKINSYVDGTRDTSTKFKSLINKEDGVYNKTEGGYVFNTPTTQTKITTNNNIQLTDSIENYDYIIFEIDTYRTSSSGYTYQSTVMLSPTTIKENYSSTYDVNKSMFIINSTGGDHNKVNIFFEGHRNLVVYQGNSSTSVLSKLRITDIKGIKY